MNRIEMVAVGIVALLVLSALACREGQGQTSEPSEQIEPESTAVISRVVFVEQEQCCDCTQNRINATWEALSTAIEGEDLLVERLSRDTQETEVAPYQEMQPIMVVPALYFLDGEGNLVEQLQGEITVEQIQGVFQP